ncbi:unnamed protein product [Pieris brassicae]|uniref:Uncharacterized protein n=1 Tax=Pieris brassicae TaxID=7116 RepID=A0A9P0X4E2_PIEBR|nr:unnamed protein product [Pieris brassicae]
MSIEELQSVVQLLNELLKPKSLSKKCLVSTTYLHSNKVPSSNRAPPDYRAPPRPCARAAVVLPPPTTREIPP